MQLESEQYPNFPPRLQRMLEAGVAFPSGNTKLIINYDSNVYKKYGFKFLQRIKTGIGLGTFIGTTKRQPTYPTVWIDGKGIIQFENTRNFCAHLADDYPNELTTFIEEKFDLYAITVCPHLAFKRIRQALEKLIIDLDTNLLEEKNIEQTQRNLIDYFFYAPMIFYSHVIFLVRSYEAWHTLETQSGEDPTVLKSTLKKIFESHYLFSTTFKQPIQSKNIGNSILAKFREIHQLMEQGSEIHSSMLKINDIDLEKYSQIFNFISNLMLTIQITLFSNGHSHYGSILEKIADLMCEHREVFFSTNLSEQRCSISTDTKTPNIFYEQREASFDKDLRTAHITSLIFYMFAGTSDSNNHKKACYLYLLEEKIHPNDFDLVKYSHNNPKQIIALYDSLYTDDLFLQHITMGMENKNPYVQFEDIKLHFLYLSAVAQEKKHRTKKTYASY